MGSIIMAYPFGTLLVAAGCHPLIGILDNNARIYPFLSNANVNKLVILRGSNLSFFCFDLCLHTVLHRLCFP